MSNIDIETIKYYGRKRIHVRAWIGMLLLLAFDLSINMDISQASLACLLILIIALIVKEGKLSNKIAAIKYIDECIENRCSEYKRADEMLAKLLSEPMARNERQQDIDQRLKQLEQYRDQIEQQLEQHRSQLTKANEQLELQVKEYKNAEQKLCEYHTQLEQQASELAMVKEYKRQRAEGQNTLIKIVTEDNKNMMKTSGEPKRKHIKLMSYARPDSTEELRKLAEMAKRLSK